MTFSPAIYTHPFIYLLNTKVSLLVLDILSIILLSPALLFYPSPNPTMPLCKKTSEKNSAVDNSVPSKYMAPLPSNFTPVFIQNQVRTKIELPTRERYPGVEGKCAIITGSNTGSVSSQQDSSSPSAYPTSSWPSAPSTGATKPPARSAPPTPPPRSTSDRSTWESYPSIQAFAQRCERDVARLNMAILNAGVSVTTFATVAATGHERDLQTNHYSTALLSLLLLPLLQRKTAGPGPARLTVVSSVTAHLCKLPNRDRRPFLASFDDAPSTRPFGAEEQYGATKLASQLFVAALAERVAVPVGGGGVVIYMVDPGLTKGTGLARHATGAVAVGARVFLAIAGRPVDQGAATYVEAVLRLGAESHGCFLLNGKVAPYVFVLPHVSVFYSSERF
jgi:NAD(P)-dependent dehydrogenase (short-subunit alcohol dehydrogenase family)